MENNNTDWMAVQTQVGDSASFADIYNLGVDPSLVTLDTKATYKNKRKIKENPAFLTNGQFDDKKFDQYYDMSVKTFNAYKASDFSIGSGNMPEMNLWEDTGLAKALGQKIYKDPISVKINKNPENNLKIAQKSNLGFIDLNKWSDPQKSIAEVAQGQKVLDGLTGKELDFTPEDNGLANGFGFFDEPLVLSTYDEDIKDEQGNIIHQRGETKFDEKGLPRYETLAGRSASGKQILSRFDTLTKEDSYINKFDYMDSDDLNKSLGGSIVKTATQLLPLALGGPVATIAKAYFIADGLIQAGTELSKALTGVAGGKDADKSEFYRALNNVQAYTKQFKSGVSEKGRNNFFSAESILNLAADSVYQLMGQQAIAMWPQRIKQYQIAKSLNLNPSLMSSLTKQGDTALNGVRNIENYIARYGDDFGKAVAALSKNTKQLENIQKYSSYGATAFMSATSAVGISDVADEAGLDARDKGLLYLGYTAALAPLFRANIGRWVEDGFEIDALGKAQNAAIKKWAPTYLATVTSPKAKALQEAEVLAQKEAKDALTGLAKLKGRGLDMLIAGKKLGQTVAAKFENVTNPLIAGLAEGTEEVTEEMLQDSLKGIYNGLSELGLTSTENKKIDFDIKDMMARYGQAFVGGAIGGMIFKFVDPDVKIKPLISEDMKEYVAAGYGDDLIRRIKDMADKGEMPGSKTLSINRLMNENGVLEDDVWAPVNSDNPVSQSDFIADRMIKEIKANMAHMEAFGLDNPDAFTDGKNKFYDAIVDTRTDTDLRDRIRATSDKMIALSEEIKGIEDVELNKPAIKKKKEELKEIEKEFEYLTGDDSVDEYFRQGLFNISSEITSKLGVKTRDSFTKELIGATSTYATLNEADKAKVDGAYESYRTSNDDVHGIRVDLRNARLKMEGFHKEMEEQGGYEAIEDYNESLKTLGQYTVTGPGLINKEATEFNLTDLMEDYYSKMDTVKYIPDFIHDRITKHLTEFKQSGLNNNIQNNFGVDPITFRQSLLDGKINNLNATTPMGKLFKAYLEKFNPITVFDSPNYAVVKSEGKSAGLSSMIKSIAEVNNIEDNSPEKLVYYDRADIINKLTKEEARIFLITYALNNDAYNDQIKTSLRIAYPEIANSISTLTPAQYALLGEMLEESSFEQILDEADMDEDVGLTIDNGDQALEILKNINKASFLNVATGLNQLMDLTNLKVSSNILLDHALEDVLNQGQVNIEALADLDFKINELNDKIEKSLKDKATSPLAMFLANAFQFKDREYSRLYKGGASNYVDHSEDFESNINDHIAQTESVEAFLEGLVKLNPIINEWRDNHSDILSDEVKKERLIELDPMAYGTIYSTAKMLLNELQYLKALNTFNKNNTLAKLLKEDGKQLSTSFRTLEKIALLEIVSENLPSLNSFIGDPVIKDYVADYENASDEEKIQALGLAAKYETAIYNDFQSLTSEVKQAIIDSTFKPINAEGSQYRKDVDPETPLNDAHQTLYLAKIFGSSSIEYTKAVAGEANGDGTYSKITSALMDPFPNQEGAIRLAYLNRFGDPIVKQSLASAFSFKRLEEAPSTFSRDNVSGVDVSDTVVIIGDPGVGKTKAIVAGILSFDDSQTEDTVLLGTVIEHVQNLSDGVINAGFETRINKEFSSTIIDFINDLDIVDAENKKIDFITNTEGILRSLEKGFSINETYENDIEIGKFLKRQSDDLMSQAKLWENDGTFNKGLATKLKGIRNIIIDEYTHSNPIDIAILSHIISEYNKSINNDINNKITLTLAGDNNQEGFQVNGVSRTFTDFIQAPIATPLTTSLRSGWDLVNNTLIEIKDRTSQLNDMDNAQVTDPTTAANLRNIPVKLFHTFANDLPIGIYQQKTSGETKPEDLTFFANNIDAIKSKENSLVYIVNENIQIPTAEALLRNMLGNDWKNYATVLTNTQTQGREYKYAIVDASPNTIGGYVLVNGYKFLNTMLSRATEATLIIDKGQFDSMITFEQLEVPQAIDQKKLTDEMLVEIKANRQAIVDAKLKDAESIESKPIDGTPIPPAEPLAPDDPDLEPKPSPTEPVLPQDPDTSIPTEPTITVINEPISDADYKNFIDNDIVSDEILDAIALLIKANGELSPRQAEIYKKRTSSTGDKIKSNVPVKTEPVINENLSVLDDIDNIALLNSGETSEEPILDFARTSKYMVHAYTSFTFKRDVNQVNALLNRTVPLSDLEAEAELLKLKEMAVYSTKEFGPAYFSTGEIMQALKTQGFSILNTKVRVRAIKRNADFYTAGRSKWNNTYQEKDGEDLLIVEAIIPNKLDVNKNFTYTLGTFNSLNNIMKYGGDVASVAQFVNGVKDSLASTQNWSSPEMTLKEWNDIITRKEFRTEFAEVQNDFADLRRNYSKNMTFTAPHAIIGQSDSSITDMSTWKSLIGQTVVFATEHAALRGRTPNDLFNIYKKQLEYFNIPEYQNLSTYEEKEAYIASKPKINIPGYPAFTVRPRQVSLIKLTNPKHNFIDFITNYNMLAYKQKYNKGQNKQVNMQEEVRNFEMSTYVSDRLVKSMMVLHRMLTDENAQKNKAWFETNVMPKVKGNVLTQIDAFMKQHIAMERAIGIDTDLDFAGVDASMFINNNTDGTALRSTEDLAEALSKYLYGNELLVKGLYKTTDPKNLNKVKGVELTTAFDMTSILPELTNDKRKDFSSQGILKVKNLAIYNGLQGSFLKMINESLIALGSLSKNDPEFGKYSLEDVFKNGLIENLIVAGVGSNGRHINNVIAPVVSTELTKGFITNVKSIQSASFYVDFDKMLTKTGQIEASGTDDADARIAKEKQEAIEARSYFMEELYNQGITDEFIGYNELISKTFKNQQEVNDFLNTNQSFILKPNAKIVSSNQIYKVTLNGENLTFAGNNSSSKVVMSVNDNYVTIVDEHPTYVMTTIFDRNNNYHLTQAVVHSDNVFNANDEAKRFLDAQQITAEVVLDAGQSIDETTLAKDISSLKGQIIETADGPREVVGGSIGRNGSMLDSYLTLRNPETQELTSLSQALVAQVNSLPVHPNSIQKAQNSLQNPENISVESVVANLLEESYEGYSDLEPVDKESLIEAILSYLKLKETFVNDENSTFNKMLEDIQSTSNYIVDPFTAEEKNDTITEILNSYENLARELYTDKVHIQNDFINNFSIFANDEWKKYQLIIDNAMAKPEIFGNAILKEKILNLEAQLIKYTHDC